MKLQTNISFGKEHRPLDYDSKLLLLGSCFVENIGQKLSYYKFREIQNPLGILFHPRAIERLILRAVNEEEFVEKDIFFLNERWHCFEAHSELSNASPELMIEQLNRALRRTSEGLTTTSHIVITLGTAWVYRLIETDKLVANCHKVPQKKFLKELLSVNEVTESLEATVALIRSVNPEATIIFTVSPVRHLKDGFTENQRSKAHLIAGLHQIVEPRKKLHYFPSYELVMDELRDYRFFKEDMIHPNDTAVNYIWEKFSESWIADHAFAVMQEVDKIQKGMAHRPFDPGSEQHKEFLKKLEVLKDKVRDRHPHIEF